MDNKRSVITASSMAGLVVLMVGLSFLSVPLYKKFCQLTGYGGTPQIVSDIPPSTETDIPTTQLTMRFDANINSGLPWSFEAAQPPMRIKTGEKYIAYYKASNLTNISYTGAATFNVTPFKAAPYVKKLECFCFHEQTLAGGQSVDMPVQFYIDPAILTDQETQEVRTITLSYSFYPIE